MKIRANFSIIKHDGQIADRFWTTEEVNQNPRKKLSSRIDTAVTSAIDRILKARAEDQLDGRVRYEGYALLEGETVFTSEMWRR